MDRPLNVNYRLGMSDRQHPTLWLEDFAKDLRYAARSFAQSPGFSAVAILTLALGIGATTVFFSASYGILFRPLPYPQPERLLDMEDGIGGIGPVTTLRDLSRTVDYAGYSPNVALNLQTGGEASRVLGSTATANLLRVLRVKPARGRWFSDDEELAGRDQAAVISDRTWHERFHADPALVGKRIQLNEKSVEIIGIMPAGFAFPSPDTELWIPIGRDPRNVGLMWGGGNLFAIGRLKDGVSLAAAQNELTPTINKIRPLFPWRMPDAWGSEAHLVARGEAVVKDVRPKLFALSTAALLLLLIACGNVANLLLARTLRRDREFALREALGAGRGRILRQLVAESVLLVTVGGAVSLVLTVVLLSVLPLLLPPETPRLSELSLDGTVLGIAVASMLLTVILFGAAPLFRLRVTNRESLVGRAISSSRQNSRLSLGLIAVELSLATTLLIAAGLMGRTLWQLARVDSGVHANGMISAQISAGPSRCPNAAGCLALLEKVSEKMLTVPGVRSVNWSNTAPLSKEFAAIAVEIRDLPKPPGAPAWVNYQNTATPDYFRALGIPLLAGRFFTDADREGAQPVMILSRASARRFFPNESAIGKLIRPMSETQWRTVVGVVGDVSQYALTGFPDWIDGVQYLPVAQYLPRSASSLDEAMLVETANVNVAGAIAAAVHQSFPDIVVARVLPLTALRAESITDQRSTALLLTLFAVLGLLLGVAGVYGVISNRAAQRTVEIGIRIALGASPGSVIGLVLKETAVVAVVGIGCGTAIAFCLTRFLRSLLFGVSMHDPLTLSVLPALLLMAALVAAAVPGWRVSRTDPSLTLRQE